MRGFEMKGAWFGKIEFAFTHNLSFYNMMSHYSYEYWMSMLRQMIYQYRYKKPGNQAKILLCFLHLEFFVKI